jgi:membrane protein
MPALTRGGHAEEVGGAEDETLRIRTDLLNVEIEKLYFSGTCDIHRHVGVTTEELFSFLLQILVQFSAVKDTARLVVDRIKEVRASQLVAAITLRAFLSLFPLLLVGIAILGFIAASRKGGDDVAQRLIRSLKLEGDMAKLVQENVASAQQSRRAASVVGFVSSLYSGLAVITAIAAACDAVWQVPARGFKDRLLGVPWAIGAAVIAAGSAVATWAVTQIPVPGLSVLVGLVGAGLTGAGLFWWTQLVLTNVRVPVRAYVPGAIVGGIGLSLFQVFGALIIARLLKNSSQLYASLAGVISLITALSLFGWLLVISAIVNVVLWERKHGTVQLAVRAPALPVSTWAMAERGGQRPKGSKVGALRARLTSLKR